MKANVGTIDRIIRVIAGLALIGASAAGLIGVWGYIGAIPLVTAFIRFCPAYLPFGISTCASEETRK